MKSNRGKDTGGTAACAEDAKLHYERPNKRSSLNFIPDDPQVEHEEEEQEEEEQVLLVSTTTAQEQEQEQEQEVKEEERGLRLLTLLLQCAELVSINNHVDATLLVLGAAELSSPFGSAAERVAAYFGDALRARIISSYATESSCIRQHYSNPSLISNQVFYLQGLYAAFRTYNAISPMVKFCHFTANQAIFEAVEGEDRVHVIDLDIMQGLQWPGLFHILASRPRHPKLLSLRLTGMGSSLHLLKQTGRRLAEFARSLGLPFEFNAVEGKIGEMVRDDGQQQLQLSQALGLRDGDATVVHWTQHGLYNVTGSDSGALRVLAMMKPRLVTVIEQDLSNKAGSFLGRFVEALHYYSALFDALEAGSSRGDHGDDERRHEVEQRLFGWEIRNILTGGGRDGQKGVMVVERWGEELMRIGFQQFSLAGGSAAQAGLLLGMTRPVGYRLVEENGWLKLGWKDLSLLTASAWQWHPS